MIQCDIFNPFGFASAKMLWSLHVRSSVGAGGAEAQDVPAKLMEAATNSDFAYQRWPDCATLSGALQRHNEPGDGHRLVWRR